MALGTKVVDLIGLYLLHNPNQVGAVGEVSVVEHEPWICFMGILIEVVNPVGVETAGPSLDAVHLIALLEKEFSEVAAVLAGDASD